jgi:hypothetical protein
LNQSHSLLTSQLGIIKFEKEGIAYSVIQNCAPYPIWMESNDPIRFAENHIEEAGSEKLDNKFVASLMQQVTINSIAQEKKQKWTDMAKREQINKRPNINVTPQHKTKCEDLICKHFKIVSIGKKTWDK